MSFPQRTLFDGMAIHAESSIEDELDDLENLEDLALLHGQQTLAELNFDPRAQALIVEEEDDDNESASEEGGSWNTADCYYIIISLLRFISQISNSVFRW